MEAFAIISQIIQLNSGNIGNSGLLFSIIALSIIGLILSIILLFFGKRLLRLCLCIIGFISFGSIPFYVWFYNFGFNISPTVILIIMLAVGMVAASIVTYFPKFGIYATGLITGIQFGYFLADIVSPYNMTLLITLAVIFGLAGLILPYFFMSYLIIEITTFNGFLLFRFSLQYFLIAGVTGGFSIPYPNHSHVEFYGFTIGSLFVAIFCSIWQHYKYKNYPYLPNMKTEQISHQTV